MANYLNRTDILDKGFVELLNVMGDDMTVVNAARVSYLSESKGEEKDKGLINFLMRNRHTSPFEMVEFQWRVKCPLFVARQWHRHRTWSYNEVSRRYTSENIEFYYPFEWRTESKENKQASKGIIIKQGELFECYDELYAVVHTAMTVYNRMLERGVAKEQARMILPQNLYTMFYAKVDLHNLLHFIGLRSDEHAQWEIQQYSNAMLNIIEDYVPWTVEAWRKYHG